MTEEEMAEEYRKALKQRLIDEDDFERLEMFDENVEESFLAGLKAGRPQWHDLREDPTDIPPRKDDTYSVEVWAKNARGHYGTAVFSYACLKDDGKYNHWIGTMPVLWTELPKVEE